MATKEQLIGSMAKKLIKQFDETDMQDYNQDFSKKETLLNCRNTRVISVMQFLPTETNKTGVTFYSYQFLTMFDQTAYTLEQIAEKLLLLGYENEDISGTAPDILQTMGFIPKTGTNYCALSNMIMPDNYKLELTDQTELSPIYDVDTVSYQDTLITENLTIYGKIVATRKLKSKTEPIAKGEPNS